MTPEEIKKIAEEYADYCSVPVRTYPHYTRLKEEAEDVIEFLTERFYLVEKGKVEHEYQDSKESYERNKGDEGYFEGYWEGRVDSYEDIFGPDIRKEEEE